MFNIRRVIPTICRFETSLSRLSSFSTVLPSRTTVPFQFVSRPISTSTTVWKKKEVIDKEEENDEDDDGLPKDYNKKTIKIGSRRLDTFVAKSAGVPSSQAEKLVLSGKVRVNEEKTSKKAYNVQKGDSIDIWQEVCEDNAELAYAIRVEVKDYEVTSAGYDIHVHSWKKFLVDNWR
ncbi:hypothetical protein PRIPAC_83295 [Pristionchus pacificus]|uniref:S4 RNA-binding domain-containing protein n=1 Tax=Pristionchus pacificus TaxID=54126 RepID=A0A2A6C594_PRIPA|nr:hypothetical protein PRIPAC_83295 [Pristionchus pacificus]|eukprot:PDM73213.1 hypothetical protein PRIPAC_43309 [Pristionchus pacificus]